MPRMGVGTGDKSRVQGGWLLNAHNFWGFLSDVVSVICWLVSVICWLVCRFPLAQIPLPLPVGKDKKLIYSGNYN